MMSADANRKRLAIYPGSFDPVTFGHLDLVHRALHLFDELIIAVAHNPSKTPLFDAGVRCAMIAESMPTQLSTDELKRIETITFDGLLADLAMRRGATAILRGLRAISDFEYEFQIALTNRTLAPEVETVFLMPNVRYTFISSTIIKDVARHGGDVSQFVPPNVMRRLRASFENGSNQ